MADDRDISAQLWTLSGQKEALILELRALSVKPNTRGKVANKQRIKRRLDALVDREKALIQQL